MKFLERTIWLIVLLSLLFFSFSWIVSAQMSTAERIKQLRANKWQSSDNHNIRVEIALETPTWKPNPLPLTVDWTNENGQVILKKSFGTRSALDSLEARRPLTESKWKITISWKDLVESRTVDLDYNQFLWTAWAKNLLYYVQLDYIPESKKYQIIDIFTQNEQNEKIQEADLQKFILKWTLTVNGWYLRNIPIWLYDEDGKEIISTRTNEDNKFQLTLSWVDKLIKLNKPYYLIYQKVGDQSSQDNLGIIWWGQEYIFRNYRELSSIWSQELSLRTTINNKDIVQTEDFPFIYLLIVIASISWIFYFTLVRLAMMIQTHPILSTKSFRYMRQQKAKDRIVKLREESKAEQEMKDQQREMYFRELLTKLETRHD